MSNLTILFNYQGNRWTMQCKDTDKLNEVFQRFCGKVGANNKDMKFYANSSEIIPCDKTLFALNIKNMFLFDVNNAKTIVGA